MKAAMNERYGDASVVEIRTIEAPIPKENEILVDVKATSVTTADWRLRAADFPRGMALPGRLMFGLTGPRNTVLGMEFSGIIAAKGEADSDFNPGDAVFGIARRAHAEQLVVAHDGAVALKPENLTHAQAASLPFGAGCALDFLRDFAGLKPGMDILILGATGGVGVYAIQIARHLGANVTGTASPSKIAVAENAGAHAVIDYTTQDPLAASSSYDVIFDTAGITSFGKAIPALKEGGLYLPLEYGLADMLLVTFRNRRRDGKRMLTKISGDTQKNMQVISRLAEDGSLVPVIDSTYPFADIRQAHQRVETRHKTGSVVIDMDA